MIMKGKCLIFSAPSGSGKSTIVNYLLTHPELKMVFSVSATSRKPRGKEQDGVEYYFLSTEEFKERIANNEFLEYEEVYEGCFYGTLKKQVYDKLEAGYNVVFDVDVEGGCNIKNFFGDEAMSIFIQPPSVEELRKRLVARQTDSAEMIETRIAKAEYELTFAERFDVVIINDVLEEVYSNALTAVKEFLNVE
jgi:guanylate kinase